MNKLNIGAFVVVLSLVVALYAVVSRLTTVKTENVRLSANQEALLADIERYRTKDGESAIKIQQLTLKRNEFENQCKELSGQVEEMGYKIKQLQRLITYGATTKVEIQTVVKDSIIYTPISVDTLRCFNFADEWAQISGCIGRNDTLIGNVEVRDSLTIIAHNIPKRFLFFKWGSKRIELDIINHNPHSEIEYSKWIEFTK